MPTFVAIMGLGGSELLLIFAILLLLFGGTKLPGLAKSLGQSIREFKKASNQDDEPKPVAAPKPPDDVDKPAGPR